MSNIAELEYHTRITSKKELCLLIIYLRVERNEKSHTFNARLILYIL